MNIQKNTTDTAGDMEPAETPLHAGSFVFSPEFPVLRHISDIEPFARPEAGLNIYVWGGAYMGANYAITMPETFQGLVDLEWRGLIFDRSTGALVSRPLHKFFMLGERQGFADIDLSVSSWVEDKLDGSMVAAFVNLTGDVVFHTSGGFSRQAKAAGATATPGDISFIREVYSTGHTPVFEWTSPRNRIVIGYDEDRLTLLAVRHRETGRYMPRSGMEALARDHGVRLRAVLEEGPKTIDGLRDLFARTRALKGEEGRILVFENGHRIKIKGDQYRLHHRIIADISSEKNAFRAWVDNAIDDISVVLGRERGTRLEDFGTAIDREMLVHLRRIETFLAETADLSQKERAGRISREIPPILRPATFAIAKGQDGMDQMRRTLERGLRNLDNMEQVRSFFNLPNWSLDQAE